MILNFRISLQQSSLISFSVCFIKRLSLSFSRPQASDSDQKHVFMRVRHMPRQRLFIIHTYVDSMKLNWQHFLVRRYCLLFSLSSRSLISLFCPFFSTQDRTDALLWSHGRFVRRQTNSLPSNFARTHKTFNAAAMSTHTGEAVSYRVSRTASGLIVPKVLIKPK